MSKAQSLPSARKCPARLLGSGVYFLYQLFLRIWSVWANSWMASGLWFESDFFFLNSEFPPPCPWQQGDNDTPGVSQNNCELQSAKNAETGNSDYWFNAIAVNLSPVGVKMFSWDLYLTLVSERWKNPHCNTALCTVHLPSSAPADEILPTELKSNIRLFITFK